MPGRDYAGFESGTERQIMANKNERLRENMAGRYYGKATCIECDMCPEAGPGVFQTTNDIEYSLCPRRTVTTDDTPTAEKEHSEFTSKKHGGARHT